ncbi:hypothetical protein R80B4_01525 [Fibrobacteres bacterium R8-0-B4]
MKKISLVLITILMFVQIVSAEDVFFPSKKGMVLTTANFNAKGKLEGYIRMSVKDVTGSYDNGTIVYTVQALNKKMQPEKPKETPPRFAAPIAGGVIELSMEPWAALSGGKDIQITGTQMVMPSKLEPGDKIKDSNVSMTLSMAVGKVTADVATIGQKCTGIETVTVPAGTFECRKVERKSVTEADMVVKITRVDKSTVWYARGIGAVKSLTYDENGKLKASSELHELVR